MQYLRNRKSSPGVSTPMPATPFPRGYRSLHCMAARWKLAVFMASICASFACANQAPPAAGGMSEPLNLLSGVTGAYTHFVDDDLSVTVSYDLQDDSAVPLSFVTG